MRYLSIAIIASLLRGVSTDVTCTAGTFSMGEKGFVRCDLGKDVRTGKYQFSVVHCETALCDAHTKTYPLVCNINDGNLQCDADLVPGYSFDRLVDSSLTLIVTTVNRNTTGLYYCQVMSDGSPRHTCNLSPTGSPAVTARTPMSHSSTTRNPGNQAPAESERTADLQGFPVKFVVVLAVLLVVLVVCGLLITIIVFIRCKNSRRQNAAERLEDTETGSSRCERFAVVCKCLAPTPKPQPPPNPKTNASINTDIEMGEMNKKWDTMDKDVQKPVEEKKGHSKPKSKDHADARSNTLGGVLNRIRGLGKSTENLASDTSEDRQVENKDAKMGDSKLQHEKNQDEKVSEAELPPKENEVEKMEESVDEADEGVVTSEKHTGVSAKPDKDVKKKKSSGGGIFSKLRSNKTKKSSENPDTDTGEEQELTNMDAIKTEESNLPSEKNQDTKMAESELAPKDKQDQKMAESVPLLGEDNPTVDEADDGAITKPGKDGKKKEKSHGIGLWPRKRMNSKSSENPETTDTSEEVQLKTKEGKNEEPECLLPEKQQDEKMAESVRLLPEETPALVEPENAVTPTDASPEPDAIAKQKPGTSASKWFFGKSSKGSKAQKK